MKHPYADAPAYRRWRSAVATVAPGKIDPVVVFPLKISPHDCIAPAGSCFAQHVARHIRAHGFNFLDAEPAHPLLPQATAEAFGYGAYSARYGNVYSSRQLLQLLQRAYGRFIPQDDVWEQSGRFYDPFRPNIQPNGFATRREYDLDREHHFSAVRRVMEDADVFVFTLGLTECWASRVDGAAYPLCPGVSAGVYEPEQHELLNLDVDDVYSDMLAFVTELREVNPGVRIILTVSPVPLAATGLDRHVLVSTTLSKAVLRVAAERLCSLPGIAYFPAYEIVTNPANRNQYFAEDLRAIREEGVQRVMELFFHHAFAGASPAIGPGHDDGYLETMGSLLDTMCDESQLDPDLLSLHADDLPS